MHLLECEILCSWHAEYHHVCIACVFLDASSFIEPVIVPNVMCCVGAVVVSNANEELVLLIVFCLLQLDASEAFAHIHVCLHLCRGVFLLVRVI